MVPIDFFYRYIVTGMELGETKVVVNAGTGEKQISSSPVPVQVSDYESVFIGDFQSALSLL